jgi:hypothetical protein
MPVICPVLRPPAEVKIVRIESQPGSRTAAGWLCRAGARASLRVLSGRGRRSLPSTINRSKANRIVAHKHGDRVRLWSRNGRDWSVEFAAITAAMRELPGDIVLHGEAVAHCDKGQPDFNALLGRHG